MAPPIERWARQAVLLERKGEHEPVASPSIWEDIDVVKALKRAEWIHRARDLDGGPDPLGLNGVYTGIAGVPPPADLTTKTSISGEVGLMTAAEIASYLAIPANGVVFPSAWRAVITGAMTTSTSPGNLTITPRIGTTTAGVTLGAGVAFAMTASITASIWKMEVDMTLRSGGIAGNNAVALAFGHFLGTIVAGGNAVSYNQLFGHTPASYDSTLATGLFIGLTSTVTTVTFTPRQVHWISW